jgi:hypothetical protein
MPVPRAVPIVASRALQMKAVGACNRLRETKTNWGTIFCWWDKVHGTLRRDVPQDDITIGVAAYRDERELTLGKLLALPFGKQREWRLPNGEQPERPPKAANGLAE